MFVVEPVRNADVDSVTRLALDNLRERYDPEFLAQHAEAKAGAFLVARHVATNQIVGFALADRRGPEAHLLALAVEQSRRGQGIGSALLRDVNSRLSRSGAFNVKLDVRWDDGRAKRFYERHGFGARGLKEGVYSDGSDALEMERPLR